MVQKNSCSTSCIGVLFSVLAAVFLCSVLSVNAYADTLVIVKNDHAQIREQANGSAQGTPVQAGEFLNVKETSYSTWYTVSSKADGSALKGYIHKDDIETSIKGSTKIYKGTVTTTLSLMSYPGASASKTLPQGYFLQWSLYNPEWAWASFGGKVYFFKTDDIALYTATDEQVKTGAVLPKNIEIKKAPYEAAASLKSYPEGKYLQFIDYDANYYVALFDGVYGFFKKSDILLYKPKVSSFFARAAGKDGINAYAAPSKSSTKLTSFSAGTPLNFADFNGDWYVANVQQGSKEVLAYFPASDTVEVKKAWLIASKAGARLYSSVDSSSYTSLQQGTIVDGQFVGNGWYAVNFTKGGSVKTGYVSTSDFRPMNGSISIKVNYTNYRSSLASAVYTQYADGKTRYFNSAGRYVEPPLSELQFYMDPRNFPEGSTSFLQFLRLDKSTGIPASRLNDLLKDAGVLEGQGAAFAETGRTLGINELYIISHALHETGRGRSNLSKGVYYSPSTGKASTSYLGGDAVKVYNMFGIGATDNDALRGGAQYAYEHGWTSIAKAVYGGSDWIKNSYIKARPTTYSGQNTLYKMLWHPEAFAQTGKKPWHQYATDIGWADKQTYYLAKMYAQFDSYQMEFDVPEYKY